MGTHTDDQRRQPDKDGIDAGLEHPDDIRDKSGERTDGRPTGDQDRGIKPGQSHDQVPTVAPEDKGGQPTTEHAPGGDL